MEKENLSNVELIEQDEIITLYDDNDEAVEFYQVACVEYAEKFYALLQPVTPLEGIEEDEVVIFELEEQDDETDLFLPVNDEELLEKVFDEYIRAVANEDTQEKSEK